ncbi:MAG TPA: hypothetical protein VFT34_17295 [Verrucomicrobiae bacterium]|nr:hypothetical protein [Verrucomicrobiae bacterium]
MRALLKTILDPAAMVLTVCALFGLSPLSASAQTPTANRPWVYRLLDDSTLTDDCPICGRPTIQVPLRGTFSLRLLTQNPLFSRYAMEDIQFTARGGDYRVTGSGTFQIGGEVALVQEMFLQVQVDNGFTSRLCYFTNATAAVDRLWPMIDVTLDQTNGTFTQVYSLRLAAAPLREIWFSIVNYFRATTGLKGFIEGGDLLALSGDIVKRNSYFFTSVGAMPPAPDLGLDAVDILPGGEIAFSMDSGFPISTLGPLQHGDLLSTRGRIIRRNQDLLAPFGIQPPAPDVGLDAVHVLESGEILFSIETDVFSERLGITLHRGDLLSSNGTVVRTHQQMLARFHPLDGAKDYGLDALYLWPSGESWFSVEEGFDDSALGPILPGDLLSDQGYVVFRNRELLSAFAPAQSQSDYGLDALYVVTDATPSAPAPRMAIQPRPATRSAGLMWQSEGRVFQVERADDVTGPFQVLSTIIPDLFFDDLGALTNRTQSYYRLRQW